MTIGGLKGLEEAQLQAGSDGDQEAHQHEGQDLDPIGGDTGEDGRLLVAPGGIDVITIARRTQQPPAKDEKQAHPDDLHGNAKKGVGLDHQVAAGNIIEAGGGQTGHRPATGQAQGDAAKRAQSAQRDHECRHAKLGCD